mmetsp:Transcript_25097/g.63074  ORF Transcript_25097/g.63074 Transcript_25097/m.63074 type:complete len:251 (-) Transcript_25097:108-860(-)
MALLQRRRRLVGELGHVERQRLVVGLAEADGDRDAIGVGTLPILEDRVVRIVRNCRNGPKVELLVGVQRAHGTVEERRCDVLVVVVLHVDQSRKVLECVVVQWAEARVPVVLREGRAKAGALTGGHIEAQANLLVEAVDTEGDHRVAWEIKVIEQVQIVLEVGDSAREAQRDLAGLGVELVGVQEEVETHSGLCAPRGWREVGRGEREQEKRDGTQCHAGGVVELHRNFLLLTSSCFFGGACERNEGACL